MDPEESSEQQKRETLLSVMLSVVIGGFLLLSLIVITGGFALYVFLVAGAMAAFGMMHYFLWGRLMDEQVAGEREEQEQREKARVDDWPMAGPRHRPH